MHSRKIPVGILGATGVVGQRLVQLLENHPWFQVKWLGASERSVGLPYVAAARWRLKTPISVDVESMQVSPCEPDGAPRVVFSALDATVAAEVEPKFAGAGHAVISNASAFRMQPDVPLVIPEVNPQHTKLLECQKWRKQSGGFIVTNPNCSAIGLVMALAPLHQKYGVEKVFVVTMQAISGAGYPGVPALDILGNVIPHIPKEEEKMEAESRKLLGTLDGRRVVDADFQISAQCNRVPVEDGHTESVSVQLRQPTDLQDILATWGTFRSVPQELRLPNAPDVPISVSSATDRPQPALDVDEGAGMSVTVGRLRHCNLLHWKFTVLSHNTIRGAAGAALLNAELLKAQGFLD
jgi:aspartate-semialdehyde dehydrogenase